MQNADERLAAAAAIRRLRRQRGWSMTETAAKFGYHPTAVPRWEAGIRTPPAARLVARVFGVSIEEVLKACPHCNYQPPLGYMCLSCRTEGK